LITALLPLLFLPGIGGAIIGLWYLIAGSVSKTMISICMGTGAVAGFFVFLFLLARFFARQKTVTIHIAPDNMAIPFWMEKKQEPATQDIIDEVLFRKSAVTEAIAYPMHSAIGDTIEQPWKRTVILTFLFIIPALITEIRWLLLAGLIPIGMHIYSTLLGLKEPREFRQAIRLFFKHEWSQAQDVINQLIGRNPKYRPAKLLLIDLMMKLEDFDRAGAVLADIQSDLDAETVQSIQQDIIVRRRVSDRKKQRIQPSAYASVLPRVAQP